MGDLGHVNASGFPLQLGLQRLVKDTENEHGWHFLSREHPWKNKELDSGGFIDLVIENQYRTEVMVIECKRVRENSWIFLIPSNEVKHGNIAKALVNYKLENIYDWKKLLIEPTSHASEFCVNSEKNRPMLEKTASELIEATEAFALKEKYLIRQDNSLRVYYSVIVTTAELKVCEFDSANIDIESGEIKSNCSNFTTVPFVRFSKSLSFRPAENPLSLVIGGIKEIDRAAERTVFVVNSGSMQDFLKSWKLKWEDSRNFY